VGKVPDHVREQRSRIFEWYGHRMDDCEFTFRQGGPAKTLGEATFRNRVKSHPDVGERWYPEVLASIREEQARAKALRDGAGQSVGIPVAVGKPVEAH